MTALCAKYEENYIQLVLSLSPLFPQVVVLCFAIIFGSFTQTFDPYPSATKTVQEPSRLSAPESYAASIGMSDLITSSYLQSLH